MSLLDLSIPELAKRAGWGALTITCYISAIATAVAAIFVNDSGVNINWRDPGESAIIGVVAAVCYTGIWLFVKQILREK